MVLIMQVQCRLVESLSLFLFSHLEPQTKQSLSNGGAYHMILTYNHIQYEKQDSLGIGGF